MKNAKRILALVLAVMMLATCMVPVVFADDEATTTDSASAGKQNNFSDVNADAVYVQAVKTLNLMGIINGYPDGTFGPEKNVTRAEFTAMLMRTLNLGGIGGKSASGLPFTDVDDSDSGINWAIPDINTAYARGIINGYDDQTFRPNANVSFEEALKMIVATLGYTLDVSGTPWYGAYVAQAGKLGITNVANSLGNVETPASRACIAQMLYDSLEVELVEKDEVTQKTILTDYLGYKKEAGRIASDGVASLIAPDVLLRDNEVQIMSLEPVNGNYVVHTYRTTNPEIKEYLGYEIEYYYRDNGSGIRDLGLFVLQNTNELTIEANMIEASESSNLQIRYYTADSNGRTMVANLDEDSIVIYNGKLYGYNAVASRFQASMIPQVGTVKLLDANRDNKYDVITIDSYQVYYVSSKVSADYTILDTVTKTTTDENKLKLDVNDNSIKTTIVNKNGNSMEFGAIGVGNIICLAVSNAANGGTIIQKAVVVNDTVTGTVTSMMDGESVTIGNTKYNYSKAAPWLNGLSANMAEPQIQDSGTYYKDINGDIVAYKVNTKTENVYYGYIMGTRPTGTFDDSLEVRVLNQNGSAASVMLTADVKIDGNPVTTVDGAVASLKEATKKQNENEAQINQLIKYTTRSSSKGTTFDKIYTADSVSSGTSIENNKLYISSAMVGATKATFDQGTKKLMMDNGASFNVGSAIVFDIPYDRTDFDKYAKKSASDVFKKGKEYPVTSFNVFDVSTTNSAKVIVRYLGMDEESGSATEVDDNTPVYVLKNSELATNDKTGDVMTRLTSFVSGNSAEKQTWLSTALESEIEPKVGDIYRPGADRDGFATIKATDLLYQVGGTTNYGYFPDTMLDKDIFTADYAVVIGSVIAIDENEGFTVLNDEVTIDTELAESDKNKALNFSFSRFNNARVIVYDETGTELVVKDMTADKDGVLKGLVGYNGKGVTNPSKVLIHMVNGGIRMICILDKNA